MKLLPKSIVKKIPTLDATTEIGIEEQFVYVKLFNPIGSGTWYITAYDQSENLAFGFVNLGDSDCAELGYISIDELESIRLPMGLNIERDLNFYKTPLIDIVNQVKGRN